MKRLLYEILEGVVATVGVASFIYVIFGLSKLSKKRRPISNKELN